MKDTEIVTLLWQRKESALDEIIRQYGRLLKNFAGRIPPTAQDAEECVNDTLLDIWNTVPPKHPASIASYAVMLTRRRSIDRLRRLTASKRGGGVYFVALDELEEGFTSTFTPTSCFTDRSWNIGKTYSFEEHRISLERIEESALYVTLLIDCGTIGHNGNDYQFVLSDELGNDYTAYPNRDNDTYGYWFIKPEDVGTQLTLKVIRSNMETDPYGEIIDDSYEVLYEIPIELKNS